MQGDLGGLVDEVRGMISINVIANGVCLLGLVLVGEGSHDAESMKTIPTCCFVSLKSTCT